MHSRNFTVSWISHCAIWDPVFRARVASLPLGLFFALLSLHIAIGLTSTEKISCVSVVLELLLPLMAKWFAETQWRILLLEILKSLAYISLMFPCFLWDFGHASLTFYVMSFQLIEQLAFFFWQRGINFKSPSPRGQSSVTGSRGMKLSGVCCINTQQTDNNGGIINLGAARIHCCLKALHKGLCRRQHDEMERNWSR